MKHLTKTILAFLYACSFIMAGSTVCYASQHPLPYETAAGNVPLAVNSTVVTNVESHTAKYHIFSEKINMTAHVGELWQAQGDVLYQTNNHDVTDLAKGEDGRYAVKFTNPGEAIIRVYYRKNGEVYVQDFLFTIKPQSGDTYVANRPSDNGASGASWSPDRGNGSEASSATNDESSSGGVYVERNRGIEAFPEEVLQLVNKERAKVGARPLHLNDELMAGAKIRAEEITRHFSHDRPDGKSCFTVLRNRNRTLGENIAAGNPTPEEVVDSWMHSPGHRANILNKDFKELGVGYCYKDNSTYKHYWIQMFRG